MSRQYASPCPDCQQTSYPCPCIDGYEATNPRLELLTWVPCVLCKRNDVCVADGFDTCEQCAPRSCATR